MEQVEQTEQHRELMAEAIERDGEGQRALLAGDGQTARVAFSTASELYRRSWKVAPSGAYGRLVGMLKSAILAGGGEEQADYARSALGKVRERSPTASYARAIAALLVGDDEAARQAAVGMRAGSGAFGRTADAVVALADRDDRAYTVSLAAIVRDFEARERHLTGVPIADTGLVLERLAQRRGMRGGLASPLLPTALIAAEPPRPAST